MIIYHQNNAATFKGNHVYYWGFQPLQSWRISVTSATGPATFIPAFAINANKLIGGF